MISKTFGRLSGLFTLLSLLFLMWFVGGCAHTSTIEIIQIPKTTWYIYSDYDDLYDEYYRSGGTYPRCGLRRSPCLGNGFYRRVDKSVHCVKWDSYSCGHEVWHLLIHAGEPKMSTLDALEHFKR